MAEEETKKVEVETQIPPLETPPQEALQEKNVVVSTTVTQETPYNYIEKVTETSEEKPEKEKLFEVSGGRDAQLARVETEKRMSLIKAWEESEKCKAENKAHKKKAVIESWKKIKEATFEADLRKIEQCLEKKKAEYEEKMKNKVAMIHKEAEERKATVEAKREEDLLKVEEIASKCRTTGKPPKKLLALFYRRC